MDVLLASRAHRPLARLALALWWELLFLDAKWRAEDLLSTRYCTTLLV